MAAKGLFCATKDEDFFLPAFSVAAIDTVEAVVGGTAAGALATTKIGVQSALCDRTTLEKFLAAHPVNIL